MADHKSVCPLLYRAHSPMQQIQVETRLAKACRILLVFYKVDCNGFWRFPHPDPPVGVKIHLIRNAVLKSNFSIKGVADTIYNGPFAHIPGSVRIDNNPAINSGMDFCHHRKIEPPPILASRIWIFSFGKPSRSERVPMMNSGACVGP